MGFEYSKGKFVSYSLAVRKAVLNMIKSREDDINSMLLQYGPNEISFLLGDRTSPSYPSIIFLAADESFSWLATRGDCTGPLKNEVVGVQIIIQIKISDPEICEEMIQNLTAAVIAILEDNLQYNVLIEDGVDTAITLGVWDSLIMDGLTINYKYRNKGQVRASEIQYKCRIDYLSPPIQCARTFNSNINQQDLNK